MLGLGTTISRPLTVCSAMGSAVKSEKANHTFVAYNLNTVFFWLTPRATKHHEPEPTPETGIKLETGTQRFFPSV